MHHMIMKMEINMVHLPKTDINILFIIQNILLLNYSRKMGILYIINFE